MIKLEKAVITELTFHFTTNESHNIPIICRKRFDGVWDISLHVAHSSISLSMLTEILEALFDSEELKGETAITLKIGESPIRVSRGTDYLKELSSAISVSF